MDQMRVPKRTHQKTHQKGTRTVERKSQVSLQNFPSSKVSEGLFVARESISSESTVGFCDQGQSLWEGIVQCWHGSTRSV